MLEFAVYIKWFSRLYRAFYAVVPGFLRCRSDLFYAVILSFLRCHSERSEESHGTAALRKDSSSLCSSASEETKYIPPAVQAPYPLVPSSFSKPSPLRWASVWFGRGCRAAESFVLSQPCRKKPSTFRLRCRLHIPWFLLPFPNRTRFAGLRFGLDGGYRAAESSALCQPR